MSEPSVVASYVPVFCAPEMRHIYRQITGLTNWRAHVITQRWQNRRVFHVHKRWITELPKYRWRFFRRLWFTQIRKIPWQVSRAEILAMLDGIQTHRARVVHFYFGHTAPHWLPVIRLSPWPVVVSFHGADAGVDMERSARVAAMREVFAAADMILARSDALLADLEALGCPREKLALNRTGIPLDEFPPVARDPQAAPVLLQAGRLIGKKGFATTLRALARLHRDGRAFRLRIAGEGPLEADLRREAASLGIDGQIDWLGFLNESALREEFAKATLFLHPSETGPDGNREGVPNAMLEAMATALPVVATRHGGIPEAIDDGRSGLLIEEKDDAALAAAIARMVDHPTEAAALGAAGADAVRARFSRESAIRNLESIYDTLAQNPSRRKSSPAVTAQSQIS